MKSSILQYLLNFQHFLVDAICLACIMGTVSSQFDMEQEQQVIALTMLIALYNTLAFCTQWTTGLCCDILQNDKPVHVVYTVLILFGAVACRSTPVAGIILIGIGNSLFHVVGGRHIIRHHGAKAAPLGMFVAPGAFGVYFGMTFSCWLWLFCMMLLLNSIAILRLQKGEESPAMPVATRDSRPHGHTGIRTAVVIMVLVCIICRAASGSVPLAGSEFTEPWLWVPVAFVFWGKSLGGFWGDRFGIGLAGTLALLGGTLCLAFGGNEISFLIGQFLMNLLMPLTLYLLAQTLPNYPGLAFGAAASVLFPGSLIRLTWNPHLVLMILSAGSILCFGASWLLFQRSQQRNRP